MGIQKTTEVNIEFKIGNTKTRGGNDAFICKINNYPGLPIVAVIKNPFNYSYHVDTWTEDGRRCLDKKDNDMDLIPNSKSIEVQNYDEKLEISLLFQQKTLLKEEITLLNFEITRLNLERTKLKFSHCELCECELCNPTPEDDGFLII